MKDKAMKDKAVKDKAVKDWPLILGLVLASVCALGLSLLLGSTPMAVSDVLSATLGAGEAGARVIIWDIRLPRALAAFLVGAALAASGAALQGLLRNPLAEPGVLGVSAAASLGATCTLFFGLAAGFAWAIPMAAILSAMAATALLGLIAIRVQSVVTLILVGVGISSFCGALMALILNFAPNPFTLSDMVNWTLGTVANRSFAEIGLVFPLIGVGFTILLVTARGLDALSLGEESAAAMGVNLARTRVGVIIGTGFITGAAVSLAGAIGFIGLIAPHLVRPWVGHEPSRTLIPAALLGGFILVLADILVRLAPTENELKLGVVAALIGAPAFIWIAAARRSVDG